MRGKIPGPVFKRKFLSVQLKGERIIRLDPDSKIVGGSISDLDCTCGVNVGSLRKAERLQNSSERRIDPGCDDAGRKIRFGICDGELILTEIIGELAGSGAFVPDDPDLIASEDIVPELAIR